MTDRESRVKVDISFNATSGVDSADLIDVSASAMDSRLMSCSLSCCFVPSLDISPGLSATP